MIEWFVSLSFTLQITIIILVVGVGLTILGIVVGKFLSYTPHKDSYNWTEDLQEKLDKDKKK